MCAACVEYAKEKLNVNELKSALRETTVNDQEHFREVDKLIREHGQDPKELKRQIEKSLAKS